MKANVARERSMEIPRLIYDLALNNAVLYRIIQEFIHENIITKEEMLCRMIVELSRDWTDVQQRAYDQIAILQKCALPTKMG